MKSTFLIQKRIDIGLSQASIADVLGYSTQTISLWENGKSTPSLPIWGKYASLLKIDLESFLFDKDKKDNSNCDTYIFDVERFSNNLRILRKKRKITQASLARAINTNVVSIIRFEKGMSFPTLNQFISLCNFYHKSVDELYFAISIKKTDEKKKKKIFLPIFIPIVVTITAGGIATGVAISDNKQNKPNGDMNVATETSTPSGNDPSQNDPSENDPHDLGNFVNYGMYPQSHVSDISRINQLNLLTTPNSAGYYEYEGEYYLKETSHLVEESSRIDGGCYFNDNSAIIDGTEYWFKVDPIKWKVVGEDETSYTLFSDLILDASLYSSGEGKSNNYASSELRQFLNNDFCNKAFYGVDLPLVSGVDNSLASTGDSVNHYTCDNTSDRVFAPSRVGLGYIDGYDPDADIKRENRKKLTSEYVRIKANAYPDYSGQYWTRTPNADESTKSYIVDHTGGIVNIYYVDSIYGIAVCPMIRIAK